MGEIIRHPRTTPIESSRRRRRKLMEADERDERVKTHNAPAKKVACQSEHFQAQKQADRSFCVSEAIANLNARKDRRSQKSLIGGQDFTTTQDNSSTVNMARNSRPQNTTNMDIQVIGPQPGPQTIFLSTPADVAFYGGAAGGGKSFGLVLDSLRYILNSDYGGVLFRRTRPELTQEGGLWDECKRMCLPLGARSKETDLSLTFPSGAAISCSHLQHEKDMHNWQGAQIPYIGFDEITHFTSRQYWYILSRNRNAYGIPNLCRATCNPDPDSFVRQLIDYWIDDRGFAIPERSGIIRWYVRPDNELIWGNSYENLKSRFPSLMPKSFTFISAKLTDNQILMEKDPAYIATLMSLPLVDRERLLGGNWDIRPAAGNYFKRHWFEIVQPQDVPMMLRTARGWDLAATDEKEADRIDSTSAVKMGYGTDGFYYVLDLFHERVSPLAVQNAVLRLAKRDGDSCVIRLPQDPGQAGKYQIATYAKLLDGYILKSRVMSGDKVTRASPLSSAAEHRRIKVVSGDWNDTFFNHAEQFPPEKATGRSPDIIDSAVEAFHQLTMGGKNVKIVAPVSVKT